MISEIIAELNLFSKVIISLNEPAKEDSITAFEENYKLKLPDDYKQVIRVHNGLELAGAIFFGICEKDTSSSLEESYIFEHYETGNPMFEYLVPFSPDGGGNHYCFDTRVHKEDSCPVVFWQHDYPYTEADPPEVTNDTFAAWVKEVVIEWTLEDYNYDGTEK